MNILMVVYSEITQLGGVNKNVKRISEELVKRGHKCTVLSVNVGNLKTKEHINRVKVIRIKSPLSKYLYGLSPAMALYLVKNLENTLKPDIINIHGDRTLLSLEVACICKGESIPYVFSPHYERLGYNTLAGKHLMRFYRPIGKHVPRWSRKIIVNTKYSKGLLIEDLKVEPEKIVVIPHGVDHIEYQKERKVCSGDQVISLLSAGVLQEKKGVQYIIQGLYELKKLQKEASLTIVGEGNYKAQLVKIAKKLGVEDSISWYEPLPKKQLYQKFKESDIFFLLSREESYGIVIAEVLALGTPCIVTKATALAEFLREPGCFGINYPPDPKQLAELIIKIHESDVKVGPFSDKIRTWDKVAEDYEKLYYEVLSEKGMPKLK